MSAPPQQSKLVFAFAACGHFLFHLLTALYLTVILVLELDWQQSYDELVGLWTLGALLVGLGAPLAGWLSDRWGKGLMMVIYFLGIGLSTVFCGLTEGPRSLTLGLALMGLFGAIYHPVGSAWLVANVRAKGKALGVIGIFGAVGIALASLTAGSLIDLESWHLAFILPGLVSVAAGLLLWVFLAKGAIVERTHDLEPLPQASRADIWRVFAVLGITMSGTTIIFTAFTTLLPKWMDIELAGVLGDNLTALGAIITFAYLVGASSQLIGGHFGDKGAAKTAYILSYALKTAALAAACVMTGWSLLVVAILVIFAFDIAAPIESLLIARYSPSGRRGLAYGFRNGLAVIGAPLGVQLVARFYDPIDGFYWVLFILTGIAALVMVVAFLLPKDRPLSSVKKFA